MPREIPPRFIVGDEVTDGKNVGVIKLSYPRKSDGKQWPLVHVTSGPDTGHRIWPKGFHALIDWSSSGALRRPCAECERPFKQPIDGTMKSWCRTCQRREDAVDEQKTTWAGPSHQFGRRPR